MSRIEEKDYFIGLDCGTNSVGFAVTDTEYNILKFNGKAMWGSHMFDSAVPASDRRVARCARRRLERRHQRISWLQELLSEEIYKVDPTFFIRLNDSRYLPEDKSLEYRDILFHDPEFKDKDFFKKYPTIYHLRKALMSEEVSDPRLLYLGISHILKHRGHFLFPGDSISSVLDLNPVMNNIQNALLSISEDLSLTYDEKLVGEALNKHSSKEKKAALEEAIFLDDKKIKDTLIKIIVGNKIAPKALFLDESYEELPAIEFKKQSFEEVDLPTLEDTLSDDEFMLVINLKALFDWSLLSSVISIEEGMEPYISNAKVRQFDTNRIQLRILKDAILKYCGKKIYEEFFHSKEAGSFSSYIGKNHDAKKSKEFRINKCGTDAFYKKVKAMLSPFKDDKDVMYILNAIENDDFLPLLSSYRNSVVPYQLNKLELERILENSSKNFPFLAEADADGITVSEKILSLLTFRIPYYVGPLGTNKQYKGNNPPWMKRKEKGRITPWNFTQKVDLEESAERFIRRMTNKCTYCYGEDVLPKQSLTYSRYMVLNELNNLRIKGEKLSVEGKQSLFEEVYKTKKKVTLNDIVKFAVNNGWYPKGELRKDDITGIDTDLKASFSSYIDFRELLMEKKLTEKDVDLIIQWITVFSEGGEMLRNRIQRAYGNVLSKEDIKRICRLKYSGWGRFSRKFLCGIKAYIPELKCNHSIMEALWNTQMNLMELLSGRIDFVDQTRKESSIEKLDYSVVEDLYASPAVKKQIWQSLQIVDEIQKIMKHPPKKVFVEVTRGDDEKKPTTSRKNDLAYKLKALAKKNIGFNIEINELINSLEGKTESDIKRQDKLYLYFSQCGKCMYSNEPIELEDLYNTNIYDVDHIYPFSKSNDDSLVNRVLVKKVANAKKTNDYPISDDVRNKMSKFWKMLADNELIPKEKYQRLIRHTPLTDSDTEGFIKRQIVETNQSVKATIEILKDYFGKDTKIVYSKARNVSEFRARFNFIKCRSLNNLHHAKDAYLNIVVGNILDTKYSSEFYKKVNGEGYYNISRPFEYKVEGAWDVVRVPVQSAEENKFRYEIQGKDIDTVRKTMRKNNILYTVQPILKEGALFDLQIVKKGSKQGALPVKTSDPKLLKLLDSYESKTDAYEAWNNKYGGYNSLKISYFSLVSHIEKGKKYVSFIPITIIDSDSCKTDAGLTEYCEKELGLQSVEVFRHTILMKTMLVIDGFPFTLSGSDSNGTRILLSSMVPLILSEESTKTLKAIESYSKKKALYKAELSPEHDGINEENTAKLFSELISKNSENIYRSRPGNQSKVFNGGAMEKFLALPLSERCDAIQNVVHYYCMDSGVADLTLIGGTSHSGVIKKSARYQDGKASIIIVDRSITGLFETRTKAL